MRVSVKQAALEPSIANRRDQGQVLIVEKRTFRLTQGWKRQRVGEDVAGAPYLPIHEGAGREGERVERPMNFCERSSRRRVGDSGLGVVGLVTPERHGVTAFLICLDVQLVARLDDGGSPAFEVKSDV